MSATLPTTFERETDEAIAALWNQLAPLLDRLYHYENDIKGDAGSPHVWGKGALRGSLVYTMSLEQAEEIVSKTLATIPADASDYTGWSLKRGASVGQVRRCVAKLAETRTAVASLREQIAALDKSYTGWSRFFVVTSSKGHIHSSMHCSTCRLTTTFGWLPALSGRTESDCVAEFGTVLCSVCFPSAPVEWTTGEVTKKQATEAAA